MSLLYDDDQQSIASESRRILDARVETNAQLALLEERGRYDETFWRTCVEQGWTALALPEAHGGLDLGLVELGIVAQSCGAVLSGAPFLTTGYGAARTIAAYGDGDLKEYWLAPLATGEAIGAVAFGEGQSPLPARLGVSFDGGTLTGTKPAVSGAQHAHVAVVLASENGVPVLVVADLATVDRHAPNGFDNSRCTADLVFAATPATRLAVPDVPAAALDILAAQSVVAAHEATGGAEALMLRGRDYANTRRAFGQPIGAFQSVKHRLAELYGLVELARANAIHAASRDGRPDFIRAAAAARLSAIEAYDAAARDVIQVHGGIGVTWDAGLHLHMRRARTLAVETGNALFWEDVLAGELMGEAA